MHGVRPVSGCLPGLGDREAPHPQGPDHGPAGCHLKSQGHPEYLDEVTAGDPEEGEDGAVFDATGMGLAEGGDIYSQAVAVVKRDRKASTSYIQRRLQIGYNRAASLMERMELEGIVGQANHAGKREILVAEEEEGF